MLALEYREKMKELAEIKKRKAFKMIELLAEHKTSSKAEMYYNTTDDGQKELELSFYLRGLLETIRSLKTEVDVKQGEVYNQY
jgi:hypothetical protein